MATDKKINYEMQGGMKNYLGKQKMVKAPLHWQSGPKHPSTELAYITKAEKNLILKTNPHGSLAKGANEGPSGIMSLNSQGDRGTYGRDLKVAGDTSQGHKSRWGGLGRGLLSLLGGVPGKVFSALSTLPKHKTLSSWWGGLKSPTEEEEFTGTMPEGYHYNQQGKLTYNAPRPGNLGDYGFKSSVVGAPMNNTITPLAKPTVVDDTFDETTTFSKDGGRIGYALAGPVGVEQETDFIQGPQGTDEFQETVVEGQEQPSREQLEALAMEIFQLPLEELDDQQLLVVYQEAMQGQPMEEAVQEEDVQFAANGGLASLL